MAHLGMSPNPDPIPVVLLRRSLAGVALLLPATTVVKYNVGKCDGEVLAGFIPRYRSQATHVGTVPEWLDSTDDMHLRSYAASPPYGDHYAFRLPPLTDLALCHAASHCRRSSGDEGAGARAIVQAWTSNGLLSASLAE